MSREAHVRFWEGLGVRFPRPTRHGTFNLLTRDYSLTHNYRHDPTAILALLVLRSLAFCLTWAYRRFATARSKSAPESFMRWFEAVLMEDWVRFLDGAFVAANPLTG